MLSYHVHCFTRLHGKFDENSRCRRCDLEIQYTVAKYYTDFFSFPFTCYSGVGYSKHVAQTMKAGRSALVQEQSSMHESRGRQTSRRTNQLFYSIL